MAGRYFPAGYETHNRKDYFESDESDDGLNDIVYPNSQPLIRVVNASDESESGVNVTDNKDDSSDDKPSKCSTPEECIRLKRKYSVNRCDPSDNEVTADDVNEDDQPVKECENGKDFTFNWFTDIRASSVNSLSPDDSHNRETRSPSPGTLLLEDIRIATLNGDLTYIKHQMSIDKGFFIDTVLKNGWTILMIAVDFGHTPIVEFCLEHHADPNYHHDNFTPLMALCQSFFAPEDKLLGIADLLLKAGANIDTQDKSNKTALMYACENGKAELAAFLAQRGADVTLKDLKQWTCLHYAASKGFGPTVRSMMDCGAKLNVYTNYGESPADIAMESGYHELGILLKRLKGDEEISIGEETILAKNAEILPFKTEKRFYLTDMEHFLGCNRLPHLVEFFYQQKIDFQTLLSFNECDIDALDIHSYGEKLKLWEGIKRYHRKNWQPSRISLLKRKSQICCNDALLIMLNLSNHLASMKTTFEYLRNHLKNDPELLKRGPKRIDVHVLHDQAEKTLKDFESTFSSMGLLNKELHKLSVTFNGIDNSNNQTNGNTKSENTETKHKKQHGTESNQSMPYQRVVLVISGLLGISALVYFQRESISSLLQEK